MPIQKMYNPLSNLVKRIIKMVEILAAYGGAMLPIGFILITTSFLSNTNKDLLLWLGIIAALIGVYSFSQAIHQANKENKNKELDKDSINQLESAVRELTQEIKNQKSQIKEALKEDRDNSEQRQ
jgi:thiol:disulfide interchange protein